LPQKEPQSNLISYARFQKQKQKQKQKPLKHRGTEVAEEYIARNAKSPKIAKVKDLITNS
jgi:hypothetical protein